MANSGVQGRVVYAGTNDGIPDLEIAAVDFDPFFSEDALGSAKTDQDGNFKILYSPDRYSAWILDREPDIVVRVYGPGLRLLHETTEQSDVKDTILTIATIEIHRANIEGWLVTNATLDPVNPSLDPQKGTPVTWTQGNQVEILKDGVTMFPMLTDAVAQAQHTINFMNLHFWLGENLITEFDETFIPDHPQEGVPVIGQRIHEILKNRAASLSSTNILVHDVPFVDQIPVISYLLRRFVDMNPDTFDEVKDYFQGSTVNVRGLPHLLSLLHAKAVVIDGTTAFVLGSPVSQSYFNDKLHLIHDARHEGSLNHDVSIKVSGPAVEFIDRTFTTLWNAADSSASSLSPTTGQVPVEQPGLGLQIVRTLPGDNFTASHTGGKAIPYGETGSLEAYQRAIAKATKFIYIEDQYFTVPEIFTAMLRRMKQVPTLEIILVMNPKPDIPGYPEKQIQLLKQFQKDLEGVIGATGVEKQLGVFSIWSCDEQKPRYEIMPIYVHAKDAIVDDIWATIGSTNVDGASMNQLEIQTIVQGKLADAVEHGSLWKRILLGVLMTIMSPLVIALAWVSKIGFARPTQHANPQQSRQPTRSSELNVLICEKDPDPSVPSQTIVQFREDLWKEHLGFELSLPTPSDGWVEVWNNRAAEKLDSLKSDPKKAVGDRTRQPAKILKWQPEVESENYLRSLGIETTNLKIRSKADDFDFKKGKWR